MPLQRKTEAEHQAEMQAYREQSALAAARGQAVIDSNSRAFDSVLGGDVRIDSASGNEVREKGGDPATLNLSRYFDHTPGNYRERNKAYADSERDRLLEQAQPVEAETPDNDAALQAEYDQLTARQQEIEKQFSWNQSKDES